MPLPQTFKYELDSERGLLSCCALPASSTREAKPWDEGQTPAWPVQPLERNDSKWLKHQVWKQRKSLSWQTCRSKKIPYSCDLHVLLQIFSLGLFFLKKHQKEWKSFLIHLHATLVYFHWYLLLTLLPFQILVLSPLTTKTESWHVPHPFFPSCWNLISTALIVLDLTGTRKIILGFSVLAVSLFCINHPEHCKIILKPQATILMLP